MKMKFTISLVITLFLVFTHVESGLAVDEVAVIETVRGFSFSMHDFKSNDYSYPSFRFAVEFPDGSVIGWDESKNKWIGSVKKSSVRNQPFTYPKPSQECSSIIEYTDMIFDLPLGVEGGYSTNNALYCRNIISDENLFISSGYTFGVNGISDGKYEVSIIPDKYAVVKFCYSFGVENMEPINILCVGNEFNKTLLITPNSKQTIEITYNYAVTAENKFKKVVSSSLLADEWEGCYHLGFIKNYGIYNSVSKKLSEAKKKYDAGDIKTAKNIYNAAINEIQAQYGKSIDKQCADILSEDLNALFEK